MPSTGYLALAEGWLRPELAGRCYDFSDEQPLLCRAGGGDPGRGRLHACAVIRKEASGEIAAQYLDLRARRVKRLGWRPQPTASGRRSRQTVDWYRAFLAEGAVR